MDREVAPSTVVDQGPKTSSAPEDARHPGLECVGCPTLWSAPSNQAPRTAGCGVCRSFRWPSSRK
eukprot:7932583-Alexandrium_andersonii.AAC.1